MRKQLLLFSALTTLAYLSETTARAQSGTFFQAVTNLHPIAYWPLHETNSPPPPDVATNYGTLGAAGNAPFPVSGLSRQQPGALTDGNTAILTDASGNAVTLPYSPVLALNAPFSVEGWFLAGQSAATQCPVSC